MQAGRSPQWCLQRVVADELELVFNAHRGGTWVRGRTAMDILACPVLIRSALRHVQPADQATVAAGVDRGLTKNVRIRNCLLVGPKIHHCTSAATQLWILRSDCIVSLLPVRRHRRRRRRRRRQKKDWASGLWTTYK